MPDNILPKPVPPVVGVAASGPKIGTPLPDLSQPPLPPPPPLFHQPSDPGGQAPPPQPMAPFPTAPSNLPPKPPALADDKKPAPAAPTPITAQTNPLKKYWWVVALVVGLLLLAGVGYFVFANFMGNSSSSVPDTDTTGGTTDTRQTVTGTKKTLTYWGLWENGSALEEVFNDFEKQNSGVEIQYVKQSHKDYRERLQAAVASGSGPDIFRFHASWTPMLKGELAAMPSSVMSASEFKTTFYPVASSQLTYNGQLVGLPLMYDGLVLYYNADILRTAGVTPPKTWAELKTLASQLTIRSSDGNITRGGLAIGNASNTEHFADILALLILQNGGSPDKPTTPEATQALEFYTNFVLKDKVWDDKLPNSTVAFARGEAAMMFAPSWRAHEIKSLAPELNFATASLPQLGDEKVTWATYWAEGINNKSKNKDEAWKLLKYMSSKEVLQKMHSAQAQDRQFGEIYPRVDMQSSLASDKIVGAVLADAPSASGWHMSSFTHDSGINDQIIKYYQDAINAVLTGKKPADVMVTVASGVGQVLKQYVSN